MHILVCVNYTPIFLRIKEKHYHSPLPVTSPPRVTMIFTSDSVDNFCLFLGFIEIGDSLTLVSEFLGFNFLRIDDFQPG